MWRNLRLARNQNALVHVWFAPSEFLTTASTASSVQSTKSELESAKMSRPEDIFKNLQKMASQAGRGGPSPKGMAGGAAGIALIFGIAVVGSNALFNVDGGHRAIKYTRIGGVSKEIYSEGTFSTLFKLCTETNTSLCRHASQDPMVRDPNRLRCTSKATQCCFPHRYKRFANGQHYLPCPL